MLRLNELKIFLESLGNDPRDFLQHKGDLTFQYNKEVKLKDVVKEAQKSKTYIVSKYMTFSGNSESNHNQNYMREHPNHRIYFVAPNRDYMELVVQFFNASSANPTWLNIHEIVGAYDSGTTTDTSCTNIVGRTVIMIYHQRQMYCICGFQFQNLLTTFKNSHGSVISNYHDGSGQTQREGIMADDGVRDLGEATQEILDKLCRQTENESELCIQLKDKKEKSNFSTFIMGYTNLDYSGNASSTSAVAYAPFTIVFSKQYSNEDTAHKLLGELSKRHNKQQLVDIIIEVGTHEASDSETKPLRRQILTLSNLKILSDIKTSSQGLSITFGVNRAPNAGKKESTELEIKGTTKENAMATQMKKGGVLSEKSKISYHK